MKKIYAILMLAVMLIPGNALLQAKPDQSKQDATINEEFTFPEKDGVYDVPGHPELKVKVFVHKVKGGKPSPTPSPAPICGLSDTDSNATVSSAGWHLPANWTYKLNLESVPSSVGSSNLAAIAGRAFSVWSVNSGVNFTAVGTTTIARAANDGQNIIAWGRTSGSALAVTYTWYYPDTGLVANVDTIMNQKFFWRWTDQSATPNCADANSYDAQDILTHELGHWMGLDDEYADNYVYNTMYGYGSKGEVYKDTLTTGDIDGVKAIY